MFDFFKNGGGWGLESGLSFGELIFEEGSLGFLVFTDEAKEGRFISTIGVLGVVQKGEKLEVFLIGNGVILVGVALSAGKARAHPDRHGGIRSINHRGVAKFFVVRSAFIVCHRVAMESGGDQLIIFGVRQEVPSNLFNRELVKWEVGIDRADGVVAKSPDRPTGIIGVTCGVGVAGKIQPLSSPVLSKSRGREESIHHPFVGVWGPVLEKKISVFGGGWEPCKIEGNAASEDQSAGFWLGVKMLFFEFGEDKRIEGVSWPSWVTDFG